MSRTHTSRRRGNCPEKSHFLRPVVRRRGRNTASIGQHETAGMRPAFEPHSSGAAAACRLSRAPEKRGRKRGGGRAADRRGGSNARARQGPSILRASTPPRSGARCRRHPGMEGIRQDLGAQSFGATRWEGRNTPRARLLRTKLPYLR